LQIISFFKFYLIVSEAERGTLNLSKAVRLLARCLFNEDELVVESIKDLDQHKVDLLHAETARWYNCTMTEVRQGKTKQNLINKIS
jgi:hypothetical protein